MFCPKCGEILPEHSRKCPVCGAKIRRHSEHTSSSSNFSVFSSGKSGKYDHTHYDCQEEDCTQVNFTCAHDKSSPVSLPEACVRFFRQYGDFASRTGRREYWYAMGMLFVGMLFFGAFGLGTPWFFLTLVPWAAATVRRFHDIGLPGPLAAVALIPMIGPLLVLILCTRPSGPDNQWGTKA